MPADPTCQVKNGVAAYVDTPGGVNVTPALVISIKLKTPSLVTDWFLEVLGTDELSTPPTLSNVDPVTHQVISTTTVVTFTWPGALGEGRAIGFKSVVDGGGPGFVTTLGCFSLATNGSRVGFSGQIKEGDATFGWTSLLNPFLRSGGGGGGDGNATSIQGTAVQAITPTIIGEVPAFDGTRYAIRQLSQDDILPAFNISGFSDNIGSLLELGTTAVNPTFSASYTTVPDTAVNSVELIDDQGNAFKDVSGSPGAFNYTHSYTKSVYGQAVTFTLTAKKGAQTRSANIATTWVQKTYHGVGTAGQTTAAFILGLTGALATGRGTTFTDTAGGSQKIYYAYRTPYGAATFTVGGFAGGFTLVSTTIAVTNTHGVTESYTLYESDNVGLGTQTVVVS